DYYCGSYGSGGTFLF
nr:immunoglobulin light chain junction region [Macaca mulatta]MOX37167.1 immunoglobulin light chain junction region [Macaca mulatta]